MKKNEIKFGYVNEKVPKLSEKQIEYYYNTLNFTKKELKQILNKVTNKRK